MGFLSMLCIGDRAPAARRRCHSFMPSLYPSTEALESRLVLSLTVAHVAAPAATLDTPAVNSVQLRNFDVQDNVLHTAGAVTGTLAGLPFTTQQSAPQQAFIGSVVDQITLTPSKDGLSTTVNVDGSGLATDPIGSFTSHAAYTLTTEELNDLLSGPYHLEDREFTLTTDHGEIFGIYDADTTPLAPGLFSYQAHEMFTGGTGKFKKVEGGYFEHGLVTINLTTGHGQVYSVFEGSIERD